MNEFQITTFREQPLGAGRYTADGVVLTWRADVGIIPPVAFPNVASAFKAFRAIAPTAARIIEGARRESHRIWTGGHHPPSGALVQRGRVPTPDEVLAIVDCVD